MTILESKHLTAMLMRIDKFLEDAKISPAEYMIIGLLLKILEGQQKK